MENILQQKRNRLFIVLAGIFITNALLAEMIGVKIFSAEATLGFKPAQLNVMGFVMDFNLTAGAVIWPVVFHHYRFDQRILWETRRKTNQLFYCPVGCVCFCSTFSDHQTGARRFLDRHKQQRS